MLELIQGWPISGRETEEEIEKIKKEIIYDLLKEIVINDLIDFKYEENEKFGTFLFGTLNLNTSKKIKIVLTSEEIEL